MLSKKNTLFTIVIPTLNEGSMLSMTVENILEVTSYPDIEVVIVDDGSTDGSCDAYRDTAKPVRVVTGNHLGIPRARNLGADVARGEYVLFIDAHCTVSENWIDRFIAALAARDVAIVGPAFTRLHEPEPRGCGNMWINHRLESAWLEPLASDRPYEVPITPGGCQAFRRKNVPAPRWLRDGLLTMGIPGRGDLPASVATGLPRLGRPGNRRRPLLSR